jgi:CHAT domain-containing protein/tetratricopeptide (TPR) repeat protein
MRQGLPHVLVAFVIAGSSSVPAFGTHRAGHVDLEITPRSSLPLESLVERQRFVEAFDLSVLELRRHLLERGFRDERTLLALHRVGTVAHLAGDQATAEDVLSAALDARRAVAKAGDPGVVETLLRRGRAARFRTDRALARACYDEARALLALRPGSFPVLEGELLQLEADWLRGGNEPGSVPLYEQALALRRQTFADPSFATADNTTWLAWTLARTGRRAEAVPYARDAARQLDELGLSAHTLRGTIDNLLADALTVEGRDAEAEELYRATARRFTEVRRHQWGGFPRKGFPLDGYDALARAALRRGEDEEAWRLLERGRAATHVDFGAIGLWRRWDPEGFSAWTSDRRELDGLRKRIALRWTAEAAPAFLEMLALRARISERIEGYLEAHRPGMPTVARVQRALGPRQALVGWLEIRLGGTPSDSIYPERADGFAFVIRSSGPVRWVSLWSSRSAGEERARVRSWGPVVLQLFRAASWPSRVGRDPAIDEQMRAWARFNLDPILPLLDGVDHLVLERFTDPVELAVLPDGRLLGDAYDVSYVPSALALVLLAEAGPDRGLPSGGVLAVAGPTETVAESRVDQLIGSADKPSGHRGGRTSYRRSETPLDRLPRLRYAGLEARSIASMFKGSTVLGGGDASAELSRLAAADRLAAFRVVHVATHTLTDGAPERCALAISDQEPSRPGEERGIVEVEDILLGWRLDADLMTLSGCETLRAAGMGRGEPFGFTPALFAAGARRILSSLWPVDDRATTILMNRFYENYTGHYTDRRLGAIGEPMKAARALREARIYVRTLEDASGRRPYEHPVYWAGFFLLGLPS